MLINNKNLNGRFAVRLAAGLSALALSSCTGFIPAAGPSTSAVVSGAQMQVGNPGTQDKPALPYDLVNLDPANVAVLTAQPSAPQFSAALLDAPASDVRIGVGDVVGATIFESQPGGLFLSANTSTSQGNFITLPPQQIYENGMFSVPYGGAIQAVGLTPEELQSRITDSIANRAIQPQVIVSVLDRRSDDVDVTGDVNSSTRFSIDPGGDRLLDAIARAGGPRFPSYETMVTLQRGDMSEHVLLSEILKNPQENIELQGGDTVIVTHKQRYFLALGAVAQAATLTQLNQRFPFDEASLTLADGVARAGGMADSLANPASVFLFRFEKTSVLRQMGVPVPADAGPTFPTVFRADFSNAATMFLANEVPLHNNDVIFISDSPLTSFQKYFSVVLPFAQSGSNFRAFNP
ncbi:polysaccharide biosynthesis/export family protein [Acidocella sp.]|uniref:polysaccharide biosynthesis/export family protein n=1 Tax=Acidocella sp. TaxID=50710 RepID=UPI00260A08C3|nr:polysaccharide biosynthesis/export family protein [Acidocella sp.]